MKRVFKLYCIKGMKLSDLFKLYYAKVGSYQFFIITVTSGVYTLLYIGKKRSHQTIEGVNYKSYLNDGRGPAFYLSLLLSTSSSFPVG